jgi:hypothetical protein
MQLRARGGLWFEEVVASAFVRAGADEVRVGVKWGWPKAVRMLLEQKHAARQVHKDEVDIIARFRRRFFVASCKSYTPQRLAAATREVEAVASRSVGRFAVPLLVVPWLPADTIAANHEQNEGALLLDVAALSDAAAVGRALERLWARRSTLAV